MAAAKNRTHGFSPHGKKSPIYSVWSSMKIRCLNPNATHWDRYGGRGITICEEWMVFENFLRDVGHLLEGGKSLERIDNNRGYFPWNVKGATKTEQANNRNTSYIVEFEGTKNTLANWCREKGLPMRTVWARIKTLGWSVEKALTQPVRSY